MALLDFDENGNLPSGIHSATMAEIKKRFLPAWFQEGLAVMNSDGGGAHLVTDAQAISAILRGDVITPHEFGLWDWELNHEVARFQHLPSSWHMFYRQSALFLEYLKESEPRRFRALIEDGNNLPGSIKRTYGKSMKTLFAEFVSSLK